VRARICARLKSPNRFSSFGASGRAPALHASCISHDLCLRALSLRLRHARRGTAAFRRRKEAPFIQRQTLCHNSDFLSRNLEKKFAGPPGSPRRRSAAPPDDGEPASVPNKDAVRMAEGIRARRRHREARSAVAIQGSPRQSDEFKRANAAAAAPRPWIAASALGLLAVTACPESRGATLGIRLVRRRPPAAIARRPIGREYFPAPGRQG
jgi:hypothetical protein